MDIKHREFHGQIVYGADQKTTALTSASIIQLITQALQLLASSKASPDAKITLSFATNKSLLGSSGAAEIASLLTNISTAEATNELSFLDDPLVVKALKYNNPTAREEVSHVELEQLKQHFNLKKSLLDESIASQYNLWY